MFAELPFFKRTYVPTTSSITALARERERISQSQLSFQAAWNIKVAIWLAQAAWKDNLGLRYELSFSYQCSNAGCGTEYTVQT